MPLALYAEDLPDESGDQQRVDKNQCKRHGETVNR
jgi:hypothetical protein